MAEPKDRTQQELVCVFSTGEELEARLIQELLRDAGIESVINAEMASGLYPFTMGSLAKQDIFVLESDAGEARRLIAEQQQVSGEEAEQNN